ncbi:MAG: RsmB/NOP family class I SAM-dependent RNA methyltransferase [Hyphomicrobiaceae bacterium]
MTTDKRTTGAPRGRASAVKQRRNGKPQTKGRKPGAAPRRGPSRPADGGDKRAGHPAQVHVTSGLGARRLAVYLIHSVLWAKRSFDDALTAAEQVPVFAGMDGRDRGFAHAIAAAVLRRRGSLETVLAQFIQTPLPDKASSAKSVLLAGAAQILLLNTPVHAAINLAVEQCRHEPGAHRYGKLVNAVLRRVSERGAELLAAQDAVTADMPPWLLDRWIADYGEPTARAMAEASLTEAALDLTLKDPSDSAQWIEATGGRLLATGSLRLAEHPRVEEIAGFADGAWWVQDAAAALPCKLLGNVSTLDIADLCAAPGGKTAALAARGAHVTAVDASPKRLERLTANLARLKLDDRVTVVTADIGAWSPGRTFDAVLLDAPCSASGTIRRHPDLLHLKSGADISRLAKLQKRLLARAALLVKPGGQLVYCVCSLERAEGPDVIAAFLATNVDFERVPLRASELGGDLAEQWITGDGDMRTLPSHQVAVASGAAPELFGMDGFYAARLTRRETADRGAP